MISDVVSCDGVKFAARSYLVAAIRVINLHTSDPVVVIVISLLVS